MYIPRSITGQVVYEKESPVPTAHHDRVDRSGNVFRRGVKRGVPALLILRSDIQLVCKSHHW